MTETTIDGTTTIPPSAPIRLAIIVGSNREGRFGDTVSFHMAHGRFDANGEPIEPDACNTAAETLLDELVWWASALRAARQRTPAMVG